MDDRLHNDCDGGDCVACADDERRAQGKKCATCFWWLKDHLATDEGVCRRYRPSRVSITTADHVCHEHSFQSPYRNADAQEAVEQSEDEHERKLAEDYPENTVSGRATGLR